MYFWDKHKTITSYYELLSGEVCDRYGLTQMEYDILMFLHNNPHHNTAAEIVKVRKSTKSHVSTSLKKLENKGLVERIQSKDNKKHIEIILLDRAELIVAAGINAQKQFAGNVLSGLTEEEKHMCPPARPGGTGRRCPGERGPPRRRPFVCGPRQAR